MCSVEAHVRMGMQDPGAGKPASDETQEPSPGHRPPLAPTRSARIDQRAVHGKVLIEHQPLGALQDAAKDASRDLLIEQAVPILRERRCIPDGVIHRSPTNQRNSRL